MKYSCFKCGVYIFFELHIIYWGLLMWLLGTVWKNGQWDTDLLVSVKSLLRTLVLGWVTQVFSDSALLVPPLNRRTKTFVTQKSTRIRLNNCVVPYKCFQQIKMLYDNKCGFRPERSITYQLYILKQINKKYVSVRNYPRFFEAQKKIILYFAIFFFLSSSIHNLFENPCLKKVMSKKGLQLT